MAKTVIIGGGVSGMAAGIFASLSGHEAVVIERHSVPGGNLTGWDRKGFRIDNCIHWLTGTNPVTDLYSVWKELGVMDGGVFYPETLYTYEKDGGSISLTRSLDELRERMTERSPADRYETESLIRAVKAATELCGISADDERKRSGRLSRIASSPALYKYYKMTAGELGARFSDPLLRGFLSEFLTERFGALGLVFTFSAFCSGNGGIPRGASVAAAERMAERFRSLGGRIVTGEECRTIDVEGRRAVSVTTESGDRYEADYVIPACDPAAVFGRMLDADLMPGKLRRRYGTPSLFRFSSCHAAFSIDGDAPFRSDLLLDLEGREREGIRAKTVVLREYSHEPSFSPEGKSVIQAMYFCSEDECRRIIDMKEDGERYGAEKERIAERMRSAVLRRFPELCGSLSLLDVWTPATYNEFTRSEAGTYMAFGFSSRVVPTFVPGKLRGLDNVILATQWQKVPGGLPGAAGAGLAAAREVDRLCAASFPRRFFALRPSAT